MKHVRLIVILLAACGLTACQSQTPTAPSGAAAQAPASGVLHDDDGGYSGGDSISARLTASPSTINAGQSSTLTWTTNGADHAYLNGTEVSRSGSKTVSPSATETYTLVAVDGDHRASSTATVTVSGGGSSGGDDDHETSTLRGSLTATPSTIQAGQASTLTWTSSNATAAYLDGVPVALNGSKSVSPTATRTYSLVAINGLNRVTSSATVTVSTTPPPVSVPTASLTASSPTIQSGQSVTLTWGTSNATSATLNGGPVALNGSQMYSPAVTTTYSLVATNAAGSVTSTATVTVTAAPPPVPMPTALLNAMPTTIQSGQSTTLQWSSSNATTITLDGSTVSANGSRTVSPTATTTYTLVASNATGSVQSAVTVTVTAPPPPVVRLTYMTDIKPIMDSNCIFCHGGSQPTAGRDFSTYQGVMAVVTPGDPNSRIIQMTKPGAPMHGYLNPDPLGKADTIYRWIVDFFAPEQ